MSNPISKLLRYAKLYRVYLVARRFRSKQPESALDVVFLPGAGLKLDIYTPKTGDNHPVLLLVHGGGWTKFNKELFAPFGMKLVPKDIVTVIPDHTLYPNAKYEQMTYEIAAAIAWTLENIAAYGGDPKKVMVAGHSSGGQLASLAVMERRFLEAYGHTKDEICGLIGASSAYDAQAQYAYEQSKNGGEATELMKAIDGVIGQENFSRASPIKHVQAELPPILIIHGDADKTSPVGIAVDFHEALQNVGANSRLKIYPGRGHSEILLNSIDKESPQIIEDFAEFTYQCTKSRPCSRDG